MKKFSIGLTFALFVGMTLMGCKKEKSVFDCTRLLTDVTEAQSAYYTNPSTENCNAYKSKIKSLIDNCSLYAATYQGTYDELDCTE